MENEENKGGMKYYPDPIAAFNDGCLMDLRFRVAMQLTAAMMANNGALDCGSESIAGHALRIAAALFEQGQELGWITDLPESTNLTKAMRDHLERNVEAQLFQQQVVQRKQSSQLRPVFNG